MRCKTVKQPYVAVNGEWKAVSAEHTMVNGEWKEVFAGKNTYKVNIYRYGSLYQTLSVEEGESVKLPSLGIGYATASNSTAISYSNGAAVTPTGDMTLYTVFQYNVRIYRFGSLYTTLTSKSQSSTGSFTLPSNGIGYASSSSSTTVSYNNGSTISSAGTSLYIIYQYSIKLYKYGSLYQTLTSSSQSSSASFTLPACTVSSGDNAFFAWTKTSGSTSGDYAANQTITSSGTSLYAVFSYIETTNGTQVCYYDNYRNKTGFPVTIEDDCTVTCTAYNYSVTTNSSGTTTTDQIIVLTSNESSTSNIVNGWLKINKSYQLGEHNRATPFTFSVSAGDVINAGGNRTVYSSDSSSSTYYPYIEISYPVTIRTTLYRSTK